METSTTTDFSDKSQQQQRNWKRLSEWIHCICVVTFDLELGQAMEAVYPSQVELSEKEKLNICYLAFPDSNSGCMGDTQFHIRLRVAPGTKNTLLNAELQRFSLQCVTVQRPDLGHYWGYVYFRQTKDISLPRGYFQKSVILLSRLPFTNLFYEICALIAPKYFANGESVLESACIDISNWPSLTAGECIQLPLLGAVYQTYIPSLTSANLQQAHPHQYNNTYADKDTTVSSKSSASVTSEAGIEYEKNVNAKNSGQVEVNSSGDDGGPNNVGKSSAVNICTVNNTMNNTELSRDDILDNYKQSKELLLARKMAAAKNFGCDKNVNATTDLFDENDDDEDCGTNDDDDSFSDMKSNATANTQNKSDTISSSSSSSATAAIPYQTNQQQQQQIIQTPIVLSSVHEIDIFRSLCTVLSYTHLLWELVLTAEPIVVMATSPSDCSHMVQSLISLISPLSYSAEARPYFTIHDSEFKEFTQRQQGAVPIILGVTNPFFSKTLQHWPHLIRLADNNNGSSMLSSGVHGNAMNSSAPSQQQGLRRLKIFAKLLDTPPGVYTQYKPFLQKDKNVIRNLLAGVKKQRPAEVQSAILRRHLLELTQSFMIPLERYMASLMPLQKDISAFRSAPAPNHFKPDRFLATLEQSGPHLTSPLKGDWCGLYKRFFRSSNFRDWYESRYKELTQTLQHLQMQVLSNANLKHWVKGKHEVEIVDMILKVKQKLEICNDISIEGLPQVVIAQNQNTRQQLLRHLEDMKRLLPDDLNKIFT